MTTFSPPPFNGHYHTSDGFFIIEPNPEIYEFIRELSPQIPWDETPGISFWEAKNLDSFVQIDHERFYDRFANMIFSGIKLDPVFIGWRPEDKNQTMILKLMMTPL